MRENMRYAHYWQICDRMFAISWHACPVGECEVTHAEECGPFPCIMSHRRFVTLSLLSAANVYIRVTW